MTVTQADRDRAADMQHWRANDKPTEAERHMRDGLLDDNYTVQAFAAHRLETIEQCAKVAETTQIGPSAYHCASNIIKAIRALTEGGDND